ncbi:MAG TPA: ClpXP protease specificity-enhancing factor [Gammaproteobacteria bacterium]|nr:ClpXP protease specificity-enhancing factor [Gammaproteobacteria bacterium]
MTPSRPYLIRAIHEWILDNDLTPYLLVNAEVAGVHVPQQFVEGGRIVLNISPQAVQGLSLGNEDVAFKARFSGAPMDVHAPVYAVLAIYAKENGRGMIFTEEDGLPPPEHPTPTKPPGRPSLKVVK